ncbi:hypothetical protein R2F25_35165 [Streptomyces sp. UP1A-1]|nr:hypothetical protein [Streptomyces sp. UP1A-1]
MRRLVLRDRRHLPRAALALTRAAQAGRHRQALEESRRLEPLWDLFARHGSLRVVAAAAAHLGLTARRNLPCRCGA